MDDHTGTSDRIVEVLARAWIECDPNRKASGMSADDIEDGQFMGKGSDYIGKPKWHWFIPRAKALRDYLNDNGLVIRPKQK